MHAPSPNEWSRFGTRRQRFACGTIIADHLPTAASGLLEGVPDRPTKQTNFPAVHDLPPPRASTVLTDAEQKKLEDDLIAARTRTGAAARAGTRDIAPSSGASINPAERCQLP